MFDTLPMIGTYITALRRHLEQVESRQAVTKRKTGEFVTTYLNTFIASSYSTIKSSTINTTCLKHVNLSIQHIGPITTKCSKACFTSIERRLFHT
jgi:hypothetical protein